MLESICTTGSGSAAVAVQELQNALSAEQLRQLHQRCAAPSRSPQACDSPSGVRRDTTSTSLGGFSRNLEVFQ